MKYKMAEQSSFKSIGEGESQEGSPNAWNVIWKNAGSGELSRECLFTMGNTKTIYEFWQRVYAKDLLKLIEHRQYKNYLELGAGRATTSMYLNQAGIDSITLVDSSEQARNVAATNFSEFGLKFKEFILADVRNTSLPDETFDCIYNIGLLEHFQNPEDVLDEAFRLLRPGGFIFMPVFPDIKSPHCYLVRLLFNPLSYFKKLFAKDLESDIHMIRTKRSREEYIQICRKIGFENIQCLYYNPFPKIVRDGWYENAIVLNAFKAVHFLRNLRKRKLQFQTTSFFGTAYLLIATK